MEYQKLLSRMDNKINGSARIVADQSVGMVVKYIGTQASATITVDATGITFKHGAAAAEAVDSGIGASGVVADATYTTMGAMVDAINISSNWRAELVDTLRADATANTLKALSAYTLSPKNEVVKLYMDTSVSLNLTRVISARRGDFGKTQKDKQSFLQAFKGLVNVGSGTLTMYVYEVNADRSTSTLLYQASGADNTELSNTTFVDSPIISDWGKDLMVRYTCSVDLPDSGAYLEVAGFVA
jgi:hypothetical protein